MSESQRIIEIISKELHLQPRQVQNVINLLCDGATIPFISRYRKEMTENMDEVAIGNVQQRYDELQELTKRREHILATIEQQGKLTEDLRTKIEDCWQSNTLEDLYLPYRPKRRTRAEIARSKGLEEFAKIIMSQRYDDIEQRAKRFLTEDVSSVEDAIAGAKDIIAEWVSENEKVRNIVRDAFSRYAILRSEVVKGKEMEGENYSNYYEYNMPLRRASSHQVLAIRRAQREGFLKVSITVDNDITLERICRSVVRGNSASASLVKEAVEDSYKRLILPSIENEFATMSKNKADEVAINMFADNLRQLLFAAPLGHKRIMGVDPGFRTGCKIVCLDEQGNLLSHTAIFPHPPHHDITGASKTILSLVEKHKVEAVAIGNGTASRETERFFKHLPYDRDIQIHIVSENGASIYSASALAREEFPNEDVTVRGAVSIARRLLDPLAELVKIDPKSIGVGQYQHDVDQSRLKKALEFVVESCVNKVGVNPNTASKELLTYISGLGPTLAQNIVDYRIANGEFTNRTQLLKVPRMGAKAYEQCAGFLRIPNGDNPLDNTAVHPENYNIVQRMSQQQGCDITKLISDKNLRENIRLEDFITDTVGRLTLDDIMQELERPGRDPRSEVQVVEFDENLKTIEDVKVGMVLNGIVTNITQFGAFVDIGIKQNGLLHISQMSATKARISSPDEVVKLHQKVRVKVLDVDLGRKRIALTFKGI